MPGIRYATVAAVVVAFVLAASFARLAHAVIHRILDALDIVGAENREAVHARARQLTRALTMLAYGVAGIASLSLALERFGVNEPRWKPRLLGHWALTHGVNLVIIAAGAFTSCASPAQGLRGSPSVSARRTSCRRHLGVLPHPRGSGAHRRSRARQRRGRHRRAGPLTSTPAAEHVVQTDSRTNHSRIRAVVARQL